MAEKNRDKSAASEKAGYPTIEKPFDWCFVDEQGQPHAAVITAVRERQRCDALVAFPDGWRPVSDVQAGGTRGEVGLHRLEPPVKV